MSKHTHTPRVHLVPPGPEHADFILELVNSPGWLKFIGERNVKTIDDAYAYVLMVNENPDVNYHVIQTTGTNTPIGVVTLLKRLHLEFPDLGFALLPAYEGRGYAFEAASLFLKDFFSTGSEKKILAIVKEGNKKSINLIEKLGFIFNGYTNIERQQLSQYIMESLP